MPRGKLTCKGGAAARRWNGWRTEGPVFPVELIITRPRPREPYYTEDEAEQVADGGQLAEAEQATQ